MQGAWAVNVDWSPDQAIHGAHDATPVDPEHLYGVEASANATRFVVSLAEDAGEKCSPFAILDDVLDDKRWFTKTGSGRTQGKLFSKRGVSRRI